MGFPEQWVFAYQHSAFDADNSDKVDGNNHYEMVDFVCFEYTTAHYLQRLGSQFLGKLVGIMVVDIAPDMVVRPCAIVQYWLFDRDEG